MHVGIHTNVEFRLKSPNKNQIRPPAARKALSFYSIANRWSNSLSEIFGERKVVFLLSLSSSCYIRFLNQHFLQLPFFNSCLFVWLYSWCKEDLGHEEHLHGGISSLGTESFYHSSVFYYCWWRSLSLAFSCLVRCLFKMWTFSEKSSQSPRWGLGFQSTEKLFPEPSLWMWLSWCFLPFFPSFPTPFFPQWAISTKWTKS